MTQATTDAVGPIGRRHLALRHLTEATSKVDTARAERDRLILDAHRSGASLRAIGDAAGISHTAAARIIAQADEDPTP